MVTGMCQYVDYRLPVGGGFIWMLMTILTRWTSLDPVFSR